jgi:DNA mismatch repair protein MutL
MTRIRKLDPSLVNKIAAGEVIERPASVVKELVENAIDAGATRIDIALEEGGGKLIRVTDNGGGIPRDDLPLALAPHATSKIFTQDDLFHVRTLGFRGEALASIGAVSYLRVCSRTAEQLEAYELLSDPEAPPADLSNLKSEISNAQSATHNPQSEAVAPHSSALPFGSRLNGSARSEPSIPHSPRPCAAPPGTTVEVRNLFYNVPARRKFLRQASTELGHATEQLARLALAHPRIAFTLAHNDRPARNLPAVEGRRTRIGDFYGTDLAGCLLAVDRQELGLRVEALLAPPDQARASSKWQYLFLNGRFISDRRIGYAIREAFRGLVEPDRYPVVFIFLTAAPDQFDVNVHPTKIEVRWRDAGLVQSQVLAVLRETLLGHDLTPRLRFGRESDTAVTPPDASRQEGVRRAVADYLRSIDPTQARLEFRPPRFPSPGVRPSIASTYASEPPPGQGRGFIGDPRGAAAPATSPAPADTPPLDAESAAAQSEIGAPQSEIPSPQSEIRNPKSEVDLSSPFGPPQVLQVHNTYIVAQTEEGILIVDQHALHERILYEKFRRQILAGPLESQRLLIPQTLPVSPQQAQAAEGHADLLCRLGVELSAFGPAALAVQSFPTLLQDVDAATFVGDLLDRLGEPRSRPQISQIPQSALAHHLSAQSAESADHHLHGADARFNAEETHNYAEEAHIHAALDLMACKAAVKAGDPLTVEEMQTLLAQRNLTERSSNCPHGRPTTLQLSTRDLERQFKRI